MVTIPFLSIGGTSSQVTEINVDDDNMDVTFCGEFAGAANVMNYMTIMTIWYKTYAYVPSSIVFS